MTHEEILTLLGDYVDYLIANSSAEAPMSVSYTHLTLPTN